MIDALASIPTRMWFLTRIARGPERLQWDRFLDASERALARLPESDKNYGARAEVMADVGNWRVEARTPEQVRRSRTILWAYVGQLREAYGTAADDRPAMAGAQQHIQSLSALLPPEPAATVVPPPPPPRAPQHPAVDDDRSTSRYAPRAMIVSGGVSTGIGAALLVAGLVFVRGWANSAADYNLEHWTSRCPNDAACPPDVLAEQDRQHRHVQEQRDLALGLAIPGALLLAGGIALVVVGVRGHRRIAARARTHAAAVTARPWSGFVGRF